MELRSDFTLGLIGGGQLARMSAYQAFRFGIRLAIYAGDPDEPGNYTTPFTHQGQANDWESLLAFARSCDVITLENEFIDADLLLRLRNESKTPIYPTPESFAKIADKRIEKETFAKAGIPVARWMVPSSNDELPELGLDLGYPYVMKSSKGGYDGYGNRTVHTLEEAHQAWEALGGSQGRAIIAEAFVPFRMELAVQVARNHTGIVVYPCCESIQKGHICSTIIVPARIDPDLQQQAQDMAVAACEAIDGIGLFAFEFFLTEQNELLLNESAPRPHNSGHYTIEACVSSQFENHIRAVLGLPLGSSLLRRPTAVMVNLLGKRNQPATAEHVDTLLETADAHLHLYGKLHSKIGRKMGHITLLGDNVEELLTSATHLANSIEL